jgi:hypothetical protein
MITFHMMIFLLFSLVVLAAFWQLVVAPTKSMVAAMPGGIRRLRLANMVLVTVGLGPTLAVIALKTWGTYSAGIPTVIAFLSGGLLCVILSRFGPLSTLLSDAYNAWMSSESPKNKSLLNDKN